MPNFSIYISETLKTQLDKQVKQSGKSRNKIITEAIKQALNQK